MGGEALGIEAAVLGWGWCLGDCSDALRESSLEAVGPARGGFHHKDRFSQLAGQVGLGVATRGPAWLGIGEKEPALSLGNCAQGK